MAVLNRWTGRDRDEKNLENKKRSLISPVKLVYLEEGQTKKCPPLAQKTETAIWAVSAEGNQSRRLLRR